MGAVDIDELHDETAAILRRVREGGEVIAVSENGRVVAHIVPEPPFQAEWMTVDRLAARLTRPPEDPSPHDRAAQLAQTDVVFENMDRLAVEIGKSWPEGVSAVDAVREGRNRLDEEPAVRRARVQASLDRLKQIGKEISATWPEGVSAVDAVRDVRREL